MYYSTDKVLEIMKDYKVYIQTINDLRNSYASVGVGQYGIEATLPKGNNISNIVEREALRQLDNSKLLSDRMTDINYIQNRWDRVTNEQDAIILNLRLSGYNIVTIAHKLNCSRYQVHKRLKIIADTIRGYPQ